MADRRHWREIALLYGATLVVTGGLTLLQGSVGWIRSYVLVLVAATFLYLPIEVLHRKGEDPADLGIHRRRPWGHLKLALLVMLFTFPPYLVGYHVWQTSWLGHEAAPESARFDHWPIELSDPPEVHTLPVGQVRLYTARDEALWLAWRLPLGQKFEATVTSDAPIKVQSGRHLARPAPSNTLRISGVTEGRAAFRVPGQRFTLDIQAGGDRLPTERLRLGTALSAADEVPYTAERSWWWLINFILVQLLLVALPEEVFFRGYLQTRLDGLIGRDRTVLGVPFNVTSAVVTSALFAVGHYLTIPVPGRLAVFFPSLLFGWMRRASGGVMGAVIYHAGCNILVEVARHFYG